MTSERNDVTADDVSKTDRCAKAKTITNCAYNLGRTKLLQ